MIRLQAHAHVIREIFNQVEDEARYRADPAPETPHCTFEYCAFPLGVRPVKDDGSDPCEADDGDGRDN